MESKCPKTTTGEHIFEKRDIFITRDKSVTYPICIACGVINNESKTS